MQAHTTTRLEAFPDAFNIQGKGWGQRQTWGYLQVKEFLHYAALEMMELRSFAGYGVPKTWNLPADLSELKIGSDCYS